MSVLSQLLTSSLIRNYFCKNKVWNRQNRILKEKDFGIPLQNIFSVKIKRMKNLDKHAFVTLIRLIHLFLVQSISSIFYVNYYRKIL